MGSMSSILHPLFCLLLFSFIFQIAPTPWPSERTTWRPTLGQQIFPIMLSLFRKALIFQRLPTTSSMLAHVLMRIGFLQRVFPLPFGSCFLPFGACFRCVTDYIVHSD